jgi:hypothetical protein
VAITTFKRDLYNGQLMKEWCGDEEVGDGGKRVGEKRKEGRKKRRERGDDGDGIVVVVCV